MAHTTPDSNSAQEKITPDNGQQVFPDYIHIVPIVRGPDRKKWKAPTSLGWNMDDICETYPNYLYDGYNGGICHKQSGTCAIDLDNLRRSHELFAARGLNLAELLMRGCQISSGKENRSKLLYRLPPDMIALDNYPRTRQLAEDKSMVLEFRCVYSSGKTCQDVAPNSIHPETNETYKMVNPYDEIPIIPQELLDWWTELIPTLSPDRPDWVGRPDTPDERAKIQRALRVLSPDITYPDWRSVGCALHDTGWNDAFDIWSNWSAGGAEYDYDACVDKWVDMTHGQGTNLDWLYSLAYKESGNSQEWDRRSAQDMFDSVQAPAVSAGAVTIDNDTQEMVWTLDAVLRSITRESDANYMEWVCQQIALQAVNGADAEDWLHHSADASRYALSTLKPMYTAAKRAILRSRNTQGHEIDFAHTNDSDSPLNTLANARAVATAYGFEFRFNLMSRRIETIRDLSHVPADVRELSQLTDFEDLCMQHRLDDKRIQKHRDRLAFDNAYHPFVQYLEKEMMVNGPWQHGDTDWIGVLSASLEVDHDKRAIRDTLLKRWLVSVVAAAHLRDEGDYDGWEDKPVAPRGVLVLQGEQNLGKTSWFNTITPDGMYKEGLQINQGDMNHMKTATNRLIVEIGEADHVTTGRMANYMKTIIGRSVDEVRLAFQKEEVRMVRRNVFCATVNPAEFLSDDQNTRWWTITLSEIHFEQLAKVDIARLWQQVYTLWQAGEPYHLTREEMGLLNASNEKFRSISFFETWLLDTYDFDDPDSRKDPQNWCTTKAILARYGTTPDVSAVELRCILTRLTGHPNVLMSVEGAKGRFWRLPHGTAPVVGVK